MDKAAKIKWCLKNNPELQKAVKTELENESEEDSIDDELNERFIGTQYKVINGCLYRIKRANDTEEQFYLANYVITPESETTRDNGLDIERYFRLKPIMDGKELPAADILADKFNSMNFIIPTWGLALRTATGQNTMSYIRDSIQAQSKYIIRQNIFTHTGWRCINGEWAFLHNGGAIGADDVMVELEGRLNRYSFPQPGDYKEAAKTAFKLLEVAPKDISIPLISIAHLSVLNEPLRKAGIEPAFALFLLGPSGTMKSTLAALILCFYGSFDNKSLPASFKDTANSLEKQGFLLKDVLTVIDDYHPTGSRSEASKMETTAQAITRSYGDRTGRARMNSDTTLKRDYVPRGNVIITGEDLPNIGQSGIARHLTIELKKDDVNQDILTELQEQANKFTLSMRGFIEWVRSEMSKLPEILKEQFLQLRQAATKEGQHSRLPEVVAHLQTAFILTINYFKHIGVIVEDEAEQWISESWITLLELAESQAKRIQEDRPAAKFVNALRELLSTNTCYTYSIHESNNHPGGVGFLGYHDTDYLYLYPEVTYREVVRFYQSMGLNFPVGMDTLFKHLEIENMIDIEITGGRVYRTKRKMINGKKSRFLWIIKNSIKQE